MDFDKLDEQIAISLAVTRELASTADPPAFVPGTPLATFDDAVELARAVNRAWIDRSRFSASDQATLASIRDDFRRIVDDGRAAFDGGDANSLLSGAATLVSLLTAGECDGFLSPSAAARAKAAEALAAPSH